MKYNILASLFLVFAFTAHAVVIVPTNPPPMQIVTCKAKADLNGVLAEFNISPRSIYRSFGGFAAALDTATIQNLKADPRVLAVETDGPVSLCMQTNPAGIMRVGAPQFPMSHINGTNEPIDVDVAVLDSGIDPHPDLNFVHFWSSFTADPNDDLPHGTLVAGVIGASDNGFGVVGIAPGVRLWNIKVLDSTHNDWSYALEGMNYCVENFANQISVANMSFGNEGTVSSNAPIFAIQFMVREMVNVGIVVVAGAGNSTNDIVGPDGVFGTGDDFVPAALPEAMAVSAVNPTNDVFSTFSNFNQAPRTNNLVISSGGAIDVAAPGTGIFTTDTNGGYRTVSGTSVAAPHVAGLVALYIAANGRATNAAGVYKIRQAIVDASLPQSQWNTNNTHDLDTNPEPLAIASEAWIPKPNFTNIVSVPGNYQGSFAAVPGYDYTVQTSTNLADAGAWANLSTTTGSNFVTTASFTDTNAAVQKFYRLKRNPAP